MPARDEINLILVDPQLKYHVIPVMSDPFGQALGQVQDFILTHRMNFKEMSGKYFIDSKAHEWFSGQPCQQQETN